MPYIPPREKTDFEKVIVDEWITGKIVAEKVFENVDQKFKDKEGNDSVRKVNQVRFELSLDGYQHNHYSSRMTLSTHEKSNLFKFLQQIYGENIAPDLAIDTAKLIGLKVKTMWGNNGEYQNLIQIRPLGTPPVIWETQEHSEEAPF